LAEDDIELLPGAREELQLAVASVTLTDPGWDMLYFPVSRPHATPSIVRVDHSFCCDPETGDWDHMGWARFRSGARLYAVSTGGAARVPAWQAQIGLQAANDWAVIAGTVNGSRWPHSPLRIYRHNEVLYTMANFQSDRIEHESRFRLALLDPRYWLPIIRRAMGG